MNSSASSFAWAAWRSIPVRRIFSQVRLGSILLGLVAGALAQPTGGPSGPGGGTIVSPGDDSTGDNNSNPIVGPGGGGGNGDPFIVAPRGAFAGEPVTAS